MIDRRSFLRIGLAAIAAPAIVRATSLMPIKVYREGWFVGDGLPLYSVSHSQSLSYLVDFHNGLNEASLEEMITLVQQEDNLFGAHIRIVPSKLVMIDPDLDTGPMRMRAHLRKAEAERWYGTHGR